MIARTAVSFQPSAISPQQSAVSRQPSAPSKTNRIQADGELIECLSKNSSFLVASRRPTLRNDKPFDRVAFLMADG
jgi:hypothetical protein